MGVIIHLAAETGGNLLDDEKGVDQMPKQVSCPICGTTFETSRPNKKYCSYACRITGEKVRRMEWNENNRDYMAKYMKSYKKMRRIKDANST